MATLRAVLGESSEILRQVGFRLDGSPTPLTKQIRLRTGRGGVRHASDAVAVDHFRDEAFQSLEVNPSRENLTRLIRQVRTLPLRDEGQASLIKHLERRQTILASEKAQDTLEKNALVGHRIRKEEPPRRQRHYQGGDD